MLRHFEGHLEVDGIRSSKIAFALRIGKRSGSLSGEGEIEIPEDYVDTMFANRSLHRFVAVGGQKMDIFVRRYREIGGARLATVATSGPIIGVVPEMV